jgi:hypothetical protein
MGRFAFSTENLKIVIPAQAGIHTESPKLLSMGSR